jgi:hypothetical protein
MLIYQVDLYNICTLLLLGERISGKGSELFRLCCELDSVIQGMYIYIIKTEIIKSYLVNLMLSL